MSVPFGADRDLARAASRGDLAASELFAERMRCVGRFLAGLCRRHGGVLNRHDLEDLSAEVTNAIWARLAEYAGLAPLESWVFRFCDYQFRNAVRRKRREPTTQDFDDVELPMPTVDDDWIDHDRLRQCVSRLNGDDQALIRHKHTDGFTLEEIARQRGENLNTVKSKYHRALQQLRDWLSNWGER